MSPISDMLAMGRVILALNKPDYSCILCTGWHFLMAYA